MTDRERWIIYPLLFLALGLAAKDKMFKLVKVQTVSCEKLIVTDRSGLDRIVASTNPTGGMVEIDGYNKNSRLVLGFTNDLVGILFANVRGTASMPPSIFMSANGEKVIGHPQKLPASMRREPAGPPQPE